MTPLMRDGKVDVEHFIAQHDPLVVVYDIAGLHQNVYEIVGKPDDLERVVQVVKEASRVRPSR
jgi:hypothetical protein